jgi:hypothetical protein
VTRIRMNPGLYHGLSPAQKAIIRWWWDTLGLLEDSHHGGRMAGNSVFEGWSLERAPTTIHPPTHLRILKRDGNGKLQQSITVTENGIDKVPF